MGDGEYDAEEPAGRRPLPPDDRVWRHPAEVAMDARRAMVRRRARRLRVGSSVLGGALVVGALVWIGREGPTGVDVADDRVRVAAADTTVPVAATDPADGADTEAAGSATAQLFTFDEPVTDEAGPDVIVIRSASTGEALAGALVVRDGYVVTSGAAIDGTDELLVSWGDSTRPGRVVGHDAVTDVTVIRVDGLTGDPARDGRVREGDEVNMAGEDGRRALLKVVAEASTSAMANGDPVVGIVELDGRIGDVPPGTPAYDTDGGVVGIATATADDAPAAIVPIDLAREVADEIIDDGEATHPWLGVTARNPVESDGFGRDGSFVTAVSADGPAAASGMLAGDLITVIGDHTVDSMASMVATLRSYEPGDVVEIMVWREGGEVGCRVELASNLDVAA